MKRLGHDILLVGPESFSKADFGSSNWFIDKIKSILPVMGISAQFRFQFFF